MSEPTKGEEGRNPSDHELSDIERSMKHKTTREVVDEFVNECKGWAAQFLHKGRP